jgi:hypothetical protein
MERSSLTNVSLVGLRADSTAAVRKEVPRVAPILADDHKFGIEVALPQTPRAETPRTIAV